MKKSLNVIILLVTSLSTCTYKYSDNKELYRSAQYNKNIAVKKSPAKEDLHSSFQSEKKVTEKKSPALNSQSKFCFFPCPINRQNRNIEINHDEYLLSYNINTKFADWVAYKIKKANLSGPNKARKWKQDPKLASNIALIPADFKNAYAKCHYDRGHQAPLADFSNSKHAAKLNYLSNITPQKSELNQGPWNNLEINIRKLAMASKANIYILTGTYYNEEEMCKLPNARLPNRVPNGYWKIVTLVDNENIYSASFVFSQNTSSNANYCDYKSSLQNIANLTNLKFNILSDFNNSSYLFKQLGCN